MKWRYLALGVLVLLLVVVWFSMSFFVVGGTGGSIQEISFDRVSLNDELDADIGGNGTRSCVGAGTPPDHFVVSFEGTVYLNTPDGRYVSEATYQVVVQIGNHSDSTEITGIIDGNRSVQDILMIQDDESVNPGEKAEVTVSLREGGNTLDSVTRTVTVEKRDMSCVEEGG